MNIAHHIKTSDYIRVSHDDTLSAVLPKLRHSHDAAFVFNADGGYEGIINPYYCLVKSQNPGTAKAAHCVHQPPHIHGDDSLSHIAEMAVQARLDVLPVVDVHESFTGVVDMWDLVSKVSDRDVFAVSVDEYIARMGYQVITIHDEDGVEVALKAFREHKVSHLVVLDKDHKISGVVTYYDLIPMLIDPKQGSTQGARGEDDDNLYNQPIKRFMNTKVVTVLPSASMKDAADAIVRTTHRSVLVLDNETRIVGVLTSMDMWSLLVEKHESKKIDVSLHHVSPEHDDDIRTFYTLMQRWIDGRHTISHASFSVKEEKQGGFFRVVFTAYMPDEKPLTVDEDGKNLKHVLEEVRKEIQRMEVKERK